MSETVELNQIDSQFITETLYVAKMKWKCAKYNSADVFSLTFLRLKMESELRIKITSVQKIRLRIESVVISTRNLLNLHVSSS